MPADPTFVDTNVLVYASVASAPWHAEALGQLTAAWDEGRTLWVSRQVLREFAAVRSRPQTWALPTTGRILAERVRWIEARFEVADDTAETTGRLLVLIEAFDVKGLAIHDANLVAAMQTVGVRRLLTHNVRDVQRYETAGLIEVLPLLEETD